MFDDTVEKSVVTLEAGDKGVGNKIYTRAK